MSTNSDPYITSVDNSVVFSATDKPLFDAFKPLPLVPQDSWRIKSDLFALNLSSSGHDITQEEVENEVCTFTYEAGMIPAKGKSVKVHFEKRERTDKKTVCKKVKVYSSYGKDKYEDKCAVIIPR